MVQISLQDKTAEALTRLASAQGMSLEQYLETLADGCAHIPTNDSAEERSTAHDLAVELGILGSIPDAPVDLSTNPKYLKGMGGD